MRHFGKMRINALSVYTIGQMKHAAQAKKFANEVMFIVLSVLSGTVITIALIWAAR